jgi:hypothetical protein
MLTKQTSRDRNIADRIVMERPLSTLRAMPRKP